MLILLSDIDGLFDADPRKEKEAKLIHEVKTLDENILKMAGGAGSKHGTGGMVTKLNAAKIATEAGCDMVITNGERPEDIYEIVKGNAVGTKFLKQS